MPKPLYQRSEAFIERLALQGAIHYCHHARFPETRDEDLQTANQLIRELRQLREEKGRSSTLRELMSTLKQIRDHAIEEVLLAYFDSHDVKHAFSSFAERDRAFIAAQYLQQERGSRFDKYRRTFIDHDHPFLQNLLSTLEQELAQHRVANRELVGYIADEILSGHTKSWQAVRLQRWIEALSLAWPTHRHLAEIIFHGLQQATGATNALQYVDTPQQHVFKHFSGELLQHPQHSGFNHGHHTNPAPSSHNPVLAELMPGRHLGGLDDNALIQHIHQLLGHADGLETVAGAIDTWFTWQTSQISAPAALYQPTILIAAEDVAVLAPHSSKPEAIVATLVEASPLPVNTTRRRTEHVQAAAESLYQPFDALISRLQHLIAASVLQDSLVRTNFRRVDQWLQVAEVLKLQAKFFEADAIVAALRSGLADFLSEPFLPSDLKDDLKAQSKKATIFNASTPASHANFTDQASTLAAQMMAVDEQKWHSSIVNRRQQLLRNDRCTYWREHLKNPALAEWLVDHADALHSHTRSKHFKAYRACLTRKVDPAEYRAALSEFMDTTRLSKAEFDEIYRHGKQHYYHQLIENSVLREVLKAFHLSKQGIKTEFFHQGTEQHLHWINQAAHTPQSDAVFQQHLANLGIVLAEKVLLLIQQENHRLQHRPTDVADEATHRPSKTHHSTDPHSVQAPATSNDTLLSTTSSEDEAESHHSSLKDHKAPKTSTYKNQEL